MLSLSMPVRGLPRGQAEQSPPSQTPAAKLTILSPAEESYVSGETTLRANLDPAGAASAVVFFVDGRQLCVVPAAPFECGWDAGRAITDTGRNADARALASTGTSTSTGAGTCTGASAITGTITGAGDSADDRESHGAILRTEVHARGGSPHRQRARRAV